MDLHLLGWNAHWRALFEPYLSQSLVPGRVIAEHRDAYRMEIESGEGAGALAGRRRHDAERRSELPAVGDFVAVRLRGPNVPAGDGQAIGEAVLPRRTAFVRRMAGRRSDDQVIAANIDTVFVMTGLDHDFNVRRVERYLAAVWESGASPVVLLNKADLCEDVDRRVGELRTVAIGVEVLVISALTAERVDAVAAYMSPGVTAGIVGSSGVGKSTLLNRLLGREAQAIREVRAHDSRGRHTTTHRELFVVPDGGLVIDTPGMREFTLSDADDGVDAVFADIDGLSANCRFADCAHRGEPGCAVREAIGRGEIGADRLAAYEKLIKEMRYAESRGDRTAEAERKRQGRIGAKAIRRMKQDG